MRLISLGTTDGDTPSTSYGDSLRPPPPALACALTLVRLQRGAGPRHERRAEVPGLEEAATAMLTKGGGGRGTARRPCEAASGRGGHGAAACSCSAMAQQGPPEAEEVAGTLGMDYIHMFIPSLEKYHKEKFEHFFYKIILTSTFSVTNLTLDVVSLMSYTNKAYFELMDV